jgi:DNA repair protein SbcD/Mre11
MKILHTADWHLGARQGSRRIDRTADLKQALDRVADYCEAEGVDVLLAVGDLFSEQASLEEIGGWMEWLLGRFRNFLARGGTVLAVTGNHDREDVSQLVRRSMWLAAPPFSVPRRALTRGRFYLLDGPYHGRLPDRDGPPVQFVLLPYPTAARYLDGGQTFRSLEARNAALQARLSASLQRVQGDGEFDPGLRTVLAAHVHVRGGQIHNLFRLSEREDVIFEPCHLPRGWDYLALGHIHKPQCLDGLCHVRYSGSLDRLDFSERADEKGVVLVEIGPEGRRGDPRWLPLPATPMYCLSLTNPDQELPGLTDLPDRDRALAKIEVTYQPGDDRRQIAARLESLFPRCCDLQCRPASAPPAPAPSVGAACGFADVVLGYLGGRLPRDGDRDDLLRLAEEYAKDGIRVNAVAPGAVSTPLHRDTPKAVMESLSPMGRPSTVKDITDALMYLTDAATVTGHILYVDGGAHFGRW